MAPTDTNIYASCRRRTGMTQEAWAEKLDISVESVKRYETDVRIPPLHIVKAMADLSGDESLAYRFLAKTTQELDVLPDIEMVNLQAATIRMMNRMARFAAKARDRQLMEIARTASFPRRSSRSMRRSWTSSRGSSRHFISSSFTRRRGSDEVEGIAFSPYGRTPGSG